MSQPLTQEQLDHYWEHGYTSVPRLIPEPDLETWNDRQARAVPERLC